MKKFSKIALSVMVIGTVAFFTSCNDDDDTTTPILEASIYERLGGTKMIQDPDAVDGVLIEEGRLSYRKVVNSTVGLIVADIQSGAQGNLSAHFAPLLGEVSAGNTTNLAILVDNFTDFFSFNTGGTNAINTYSGLGMVEAHDPSINGRMGVKSTEADYNKFVGYVGAAAVVNGVPADSELYADIVDVLLSLKGPIVQE